MYGAQAGYAGYPVSRRVARAVPRPI
jgi:hypothetical protein